MQQWQSQGLGIAAITLLLDDPDEGPPTQSGVDTWIQNFGLTLSSVAADPYFQMVPGSSVGTPQMTVIDPRTMTVVMLQEGAGGSVHSTLVNLAQQNQ